MRYSDKVNDHFNNPRNMGSMDRQDPQVGTAVVGAPACGDVMQLQLKISEEGVIEDAKFKTFGCGSAIASSSLVTTMVKGKRVEEAETRFAMSILRLNWNCPRKRFTVPYLLRMQSKKPSETIKKRKRNRLSNLFDSTN